MHYEICNKCHLKRLCLQRQTECKRLKTVYDAMEDDLNKLIEDYHRAYNQMLMEEVDHE